MMGLKNCDIYLTRGMDIDNKFLRNKLSFSLDNKNRVIIPIADGNGKSTTEKKENDELDGTKADIALESGISSVLTDEILSNAFAEKKNEIPEYYIASEIKTLIGKKQLRHVYSVNSGKFNSYLTFFT